MPKRAFVAVTLCVALGGCSTLTTAGETPSPALLRVTVVQDQSGGAYIEGAAHYLRMTGSGVDTQLRLNEGSPTAFSLPEGSYELESWARPCDGTCSHLDGPTDRCTGTFPLTGGATTAIEVTASPGKACTLAVIPS